MNMHANGFPVIIISIKLVTTLLLVFSWATVVTANVVLNLTSSVCVDVGKDASDVSRLHTYANILINQVHQRSKATWILCNTLDNDDERDKVQSSLRGMPFSSMVRVKLEIMETKNTFLSKEGYIINASTVAKRHTTHDPPQIIYVSGTDERGVLFGVGRFLRLLDTQYTEGYDTQPCSWVGLNMSFSPIVSSPDYTMRGHQLGYRPKTNSYDGWTAEQYEAYIIELSLFGCNMIELMPWHTDDVPFSPMYSQDSRTMLHTVANITRKYGLDIGMWWPLKYDNVSDWLEVLHQLPALDNVQIPAGDPGNASPKDLLAKSRLFADTVHSIFPSADIWIGPQEWSPDEMDEWRKELNQILTATEDNTLNNASLSSTTQWLTGVVYGPHTCFNLNEFITGGYHGGLPLRLYPDITHSLTTQFPVPKWDRAFQVQ